jgi:recombination protein RecT
MSGSNGNGKSIALAQRANDLRRQLQSKERRDAIFSAAASHINPDRFIECIARSCLATPSLFDCNPASLFISAAEAARLGLELGGVLGQAYLVPYSGEAQLVLGYKGYKELAYRSDKVSVINAGTVYEGDEFEWCRGTEEFIRHKPTDLPSTKWTHCWAFAKTIHGEPIISVMSKAQIEAHRNRFAKGWNRPGSAWLSNPESMGQKTQLHRVSRLLPLSPEIQQLVERSEYIDNDAPLLGNGSAVSKVAHSDINDQLDGKVSEGEVDGEVVGVTESLPDDPNEWGEEARW